jgi:hypothetical protein
MGTLALSGTLDFAGMLNLGDKVTVGGAEALVVSSSQQGTAPGPVLIPPPPAGPANPNVDVHVIVSFNQTVKAGPNAIVTQGMVMQGQQWPGMVLPSSANPTVTVNHIAMNVVNDQAIILPSGMSVQLTTSGQ